MRRLLNDGFFEKLYIDDFGVQDDERTEPVRELEKLMTANCAALAARSNEERPGLATGSLVLID